MLFTGHYEHLIDEKNRLSIPANYRNQLNPERDGKGFYVTPGATENSLWLYPQKMFEQQSDRTEPGLVPSKAQRAIDETLYTFAVYAELDSAGRIAMPASHLQMANLTREVTLKGLRNRIEVVNRTEFDGVKQAKWRNFAAMLAKEE